MKNNKYSSAIPLLMILGLLSSKALAVSIDLKDFVGDPEVTIASDGLSAMFTESDFSTVVVLTNDPFLGDPDVIVPNASTILTFDFDFTEAPGDDDEFSAYLFLAEDGPIDGVLDQFTVNTSQAGTARFDLDPYYSSSTGEALQLGLQFELFDNLGGSSDSTLTISNLTLTQVPLPAAFWLLTSSLIGFVTATARQKNV